MVTVIWSHHAKTAYSTKCCLAFYTNLKLVNVSACIGSSILPGLKQVLVFQLQFLHVYNFDVIDMEFLLDLCLLNLLFPRISTETVWHPHSSPWCKLLAVIIYQFQPQQTQGTLCNIVILSCNIVSSRWPLKTINHQPCKNGLKQVTVSTTLNSSISETLYLTSVFLT